MDYERWNLMVVFEKEFKGCNEIIVPVRSFCMSSLKLLHSTGLSLCR